MKKFLIIILAVLLVVMCFACEKKANKGIDNNKYIIDVSIEDDINCKQTVLFKNTLKKDLDELKFHLYANAYSQGAENKAYTEELLKYGGIEISLLKVNDETTNYSLNADKSLLTVNIPKMDVNDQAEIYMEYTVVMPECNLRLGKYNDVYNLGNFYPILAYYQNGNWREDSFTTVGDPFLASISDYEVTINAQSNMVVACSGDIESNEVLENRKTIKAKANSVRDFAIVASNRFSVMTKMVKKTMVYYYYFNDIEPQRTLKTAANAIKVFGEAFGAYPYNSYRVVETPFAYGGMEYPTLVYISSAEKDKDSVVVHETAHQWWALLVGSDSINESFLDEGLATFSASYYHLLNKDEKKFNEEMEKYNKNYHSFIKIKQMSDPEYVPNMNMPLKDFAPNEYNAICYDKSSVMFKTIYDIMGKKKFDKALKNFYESNKYRVATKEDLYSSFNKAGGSDIGKIFDSWIQGTTHTFSFA